MKSQSGSSPIVIISLVVALLSLALSGYLLLTKNQPVSPIQDAPAPTSNISPPSSTPSPTPNPTASWKTYSNNTFNYSIKYPNQYEIPPQTSRQINQLGKDNNLCVLDTSSRECAVTIDVSDLKPEEIIKIYTPNQPEENFKQTNRRMVGIQFTELNTTNAEGVTTIRLITTRNNKTFTITYQDITGPDAPSILSTFRFD